MQSKNTNFLIPRRPHADSLATVANGKFGYCFIRFSPIREHTSNSSWSLSLWAHLKHIYVNLTDLVYGGKTNKCLLINTYLSISDTSSEMKTPVKRVVSAWRSDLASRMHFHASSSSLAQVNQRWLLAKIENAQTIQTYPLYNSTQQVNMKYPPTTIFFRKWRNSKTLMRNFNPCFVSVQKLKETLCEWQNGNLKTQTRSQPDLQPLFIDLTIV